MLLSSLKGVWFNKKERAYLSQAELIGKARKRVDHLDLSSLLNYF